jgi:RHS repeat-associated protein
VSRPRWFVTIFLALMAVLVPSRASASMAPESETRTGDFHVTHPVLVGLITTQIPGKHRAIPLFAYDPASDRCFRWKGRPFLNVAGGIYDMRARFWSPGMGAFLTIDGFAYHDANTTLWGWPGQNPIQFPDPTGHWYVPPPPAPLVAPLGPFAVFAAIVALPITYAAYTIATELDAFNHPTVTHGGVCSASGGGGMGGGGGPPPVTSSGGGGGGDAGIPGISAKIARQMGARGWTADQIIEAIESGQQVDAVNMANGNPSIRYINPTTGQSVVVDTVTNEVIHVGGPGFQYGPGSGDLP